MKKLFARALLLLLAACLCLTALAAEGEPVTTVEYDEDGNPYTVVDNGNGEVFASGEMPEYGDNEMVITFPSETEQQPSDEPSATQESDPKEPQSERAAPLPELTPENASGTEEKPMTGVILGIIALAVCAVLAVALLRKKRGAAGN